MEKISLSQDQQFWEVYDKLIDRMEKTSLTRVEAQQEMNALSNANNANVSINFSSYRFPDENVINDKIAIFERNIETLNNKKELADTTKNNIASLKELIKKVNLKDQLRLDTQEMSDERDALSAEIDELEKKLTTHETLNDTNNDTYKDLKILKSVRELDLEEKQSVIDENTIKLNDNSMEIEIENTSEQLKIDMNITDSNLKINNLLQIANLETRNIITLTDLDATLVEKNAYLNTLKTEKDTITEQNKNYRLAMREQLVKLKKAKDNTNNGFNELQKELNKLADVTPGIYGDTLRQFTQNATAAESDKRRLELKASLTEKIKKKFNQGGSKHEAEVEIEIGAELGSEILGDITARGSVFVSAKLIVAYDNDGKYNVSYEINPKFKVRGRAEVALSNDQKLKLRASLAGGFNIGNTKTYDSLDDFIDNECNNISAAYLDYSLSKNPIPTRIFKEMAVQNKAIVNTETAIAYKDSLENNLRIMGVIGSDKELSVPERKKITYVKTKSYTGSAEAQASAALQITNNFGAGGGIKIDGSLMKTQKQKQINLIDDLMQHPSLQTIYAKKNPKNFGFVSIGNNKRVYLSGDLAIKKLNCIEENINSYSNNPTEENKLNLKEESKQIKQNLECLHLEYQAFVSAENKAEYQGDQDSINNRNKMREARGVFDSANYLKAVSLQYANLRRLYNKTLPDNQLPDASDTALFDGFEQDLKNPKFKISEDNYAKVFNIDQNTKNTTVISGGISRTIENRFFAPEYNNSRATAPGIQFSLKYSHIKPPDENATEELTFSIDIISGIKGDQFVAKLFQIADVKQLLSNSEAENDIKSGIMDAIKSGFTGAIEVKAQRNENGFHCKYIRGYDTSEKAAGGKAKIEVMPGVKVLAGGTISTAHTTTTFEKPGTNSLSYITDVYRAKKIRSNRDNEWETYNQETNMLNDMLKKLANKDSNISKEMLQWCTEMEISGDDSKLAMAKQLKQKLKDYRDPNKQTTAQDIEQDFVNIVAQRTKDEDDEELKKFVTCRNAQRTGIREYAATVIANRMDTIVIENDLNEKSAGTVDKLLKHAKAEYKKDPTSLKNFKLLKSAYAIEYASSNLEDLISSDKLEKQNTVLTLLDSEMDALLQDQSKIYLGKGLEGELSREADGKLVVKTKIIKGKENTFTKDEIENKIKTQLGTLSYEAKPTTQTNDTGTEVTWTEPPKKQLKSQRSSRYIGQKLRSLKSHTGGSKKISQYIAMVMEKTFEKRKKQQQAQKAHRSMAVAST